MHKDRYPRILIDLKKLRHNLDYMTALCRDKGVQVAGVIKGCSGLPECTAQFAEAGCRFIASSRLEQIETAIDFGIRADFMLIRIPMLSEAADTVRLTQISLNSELSVLEELNREAGIQEKRHKVILMADVGDLREGFWNKEDLLEAALAVEYEMPHLDLAGVGTNLGCYGSVAATPEKMEELVQCAEMIEGKIGRTLEYISGGSTTSIPLILDNKMHPRINLLRIGEAVLLARDLQDLWKYDMSQMHQDVFRLQAEVIEVKEKPSYPQGEIMYDAFCKKRQYEDRGIHKRAILGMGKIDYAFPDQLIPKDRELEILGASSDHTILDVQNCSHQYKVGDIAEFDLWYPSLVYATNSPNVNIVYL